MFLICSFFVHLSNEKKVWSNSYEMPWNSFLEISFENQCVGFIRLNPPGQMKRFLVAPHLGERFRANVPSAAFQRLGPLGFACGTEWIVWMDLPGFAGYATRFQAMVKVAQCAEIIDDGEDCFAGICVFDCFAAV